MNANDRLTYVVYRWGKLLARLSGKVETICHCGDHTFNDSKECDTCEMLRRMA